MLKILRKILYFKDRSNFMHDNSMPESWIRDKRSVSSVLAKKKRKPNKIIVNIIMCIYNVKNTDWIPAAYRSCAQGMRSDDPSSLLSVCVTLQL